MFAACGQNLSQTYKNTSSMLDSHPSTSRCSLHKSSTMWSLKVWAGRCLCFHLQFPPGLWMNNRQAPETGPHPPQTDQPLAVFQSKCVHSAHFALLWTGSSRCSVVCLKMWREIAPESCIPKGLLTTTFKSCAGIFCSAFFRWNMKMWVGL